MRYFTMQIKFVLLIQLKSYTIKMEIEMIEYMYKENVMYNKQTENYTKQMKNKKYIWIRS